MAENPEVPDLKKALENKPAGFAWAPVAKSAASAAGRPQAAPPKARGRLAAAAGLLVAGGLVFAYAAFRFGGSADGGAGGAKLGGVASSMKIRFARQNDPTGYVVREKSAAADEKMRFDLIKAAEDKGPGGAAAGGAPGGSEGGAPMNYDETPASRASGAAAAAAGAKGLDGGQGGAGGLAGGGAPRLNASASSIKFQGMRRVSGTAGFRNISGGRGTPSRVIQTRGSSANPFGAGAGGNAASGGSASSGGRGGGAAGVLSGGPAGGGAGAASGAGGGGGGGGGSGTADIGELSTAEETSGKIADLLSQAKSDRDRAEDEKKKAMALKALGQDPQAAYHYDRYQKAKKEADKKKAEADRLTAEMAGAAGGITVQPEP